MAMEKDNVIILGEEYEETKKPKRLIDIPKKEAEFMKAVIMHTAKAKKDPKAPSMTAQAVDELITITRKYALALDYCFETMQFTLNSLARLNGEKTGYSEIIKTLAEHLNEILDVGHIKDESQN